MVLTESKVWTAAMELGRRAEVMLCWVGIEAGADSVRTRAPKDEQDGDDGRDDRRGDEELTTRVTDAGRTGDEGLTTAPAPLDSQDCRCLATGAGIATALEPV